VVGASSGIGQELVRQLAKQGCRVAALARRKDRLDELAAQEGDRVLPFEHDVTRYDEVPLLFQQITKALGGLDLIIYAAGVMPTIEPTEYRFDLDQTIFEVNVLGAMAWLDQAAIRFANTRTGTIVAIGSVAGERGRAGQPAYNASKAALATFMEALRNRLSRRGVKVVTVKPGPVDTPMAAEVSTTKLPVEKAASLILAKAQNTGEHYLLLPHKVAFAIIRNIPSPIFRRLNI